MKLTRDSTAVKGHRAILFNKAQSALQITCQSCSIRIVRIGRLSSGGGKGKILATLAHPDISSKDFSATAIEAVIVPALDGEGPLWLQIRRSLATAILNGDWPAGTRIPAEMLLTKHYATSRMTANKAIQSLAAEGLVERRPKTGTIVTGKARERPVLEIWDAADAVRRSGGQYGYRLLECGMVPADSPYRAQLDIDAQTPMIRMLCLHLSDDHPFQLEERLINVEAAPKVTCQPLEVVSPSQWLLVHVPWTEAKHSISARGANPTVAGHLAIEPGTACLVVERRTWNGDLPVTLGRFWYPGDEHSLEGQFRPSW